MGSWWWCWWLKANLRVTGTYCIELWGQSLVAEVVGSSLVVKIWMYIWEANFFYKQNSSKWSHTFPTEGFAFFWTQTTKATKTRKVTTIMFEGPRRFELPQPWLKHPLDIQLFFAKLRWDWCWIGRWFGDVWSWYLLSFGVTECLGILKIN